MRFYKQIFINIFPKRKKIYENLTVLNTNLVKNGK